MRNFLTQFEPCHCQIEQRISPTHSYFLLLCECINLGRLLRIKNIIPKWFIEIWRQWNRFNKTVQHISLKNLSRKFFSYDLSYYRFIIFAINSISLQYMYSSIVTSNRDSTILLQVIKYYNFLEFFMYIDMLYTKSLSAIISVGDWQKNAHTLVSQIHVTHEILLFSLPPHKIKKACDLESFSNVNANLLQSTPTLLQQYLIRRLCQIFWRDQWL